MSRKDQLTIDPDPFTDNEFPPGMIIEDETGLSNLTFAQLLLSDMLKKYPSIPVAIADTGHWLGWVAGHWPHVKSEHFKGGPRNPSGLPHRFLWNRAEADQADSGPGPEGLRSLVTELLSWDHQHHRPTAIVYPQILVVQEPSLAEWAILNEVGPSAINERLAIIAITQGLPDNEAIGAVRTTLPILVAFRERAEFLIQTSQGLYHGALPEDGLDDPDP